VRAIFLGSGPRVRAIYFRGRSKGARVFFFGERSKSATVEVGHPTVQTSKRVHCQATLDFSSEKSRAPLLRTPLKKNLARTLGPKKLARTLVDRHPKKSRAPLDRLEKNSLTFVPSTEKLARPIREKTGLDPAIDL
jgi:hypothetical protein